MGAAEFLCQGNSHLVIQKLPAFSVLSLFTILLSGTNFVQHIPAEMSVVPRKNTKFSSFGNLLLSL
jgi:hypothetical protein